MAKRQKTRILGVADSSTVTDSLQSGGGRVGRGGHPSSCRSIKKALFAQWSELKNPSAERLEALAAMLDDSLPSTPLLLARFDFLQSKFSWQTGFPLHRSPSSSSCFNPASPGHQQVAVPIVQAQAGLPAPHPLLSHPIYRRRFHYRVH